MMDESTQAKFNEKLKEVVAAGKKKGFAEYQEIIDTFAEFGLEEEEFDKIWETLDKSKIVLRIETMSVLLEKVSVLRILSVCI